MPVKTEQLDSPVTQRDVQANCHHPANKPDAYSERPPQNPRECFPPTL